MDCKNELQAEVQEFREQLKVTAEQLEARADELVSTVHNHF